MEHLLMQDSALLLIAFIIAAWLYIRVRARGYL
jgi:energy-converting hydrogenase Eha subunit F